MIVKTRGALAVPRLIRLVGGVWVEFSVRPLVLGDNKSIKAISFALLSKPHEKIAENALTQEKSSPIVIARAEVVC